MNGIATLLTTALLSATLTAGAQTAGRDMHNAGHDTHDAAVNTGHAVSHTTSHAYHKTTHATSHAYHATARGTKNVARDTGYQAHRLGNALTGKPAPVHPEDEHGH